MFISLDKTSVVVDNKETTVPGSDEVSLSKNFKENNPPDGKKISLHLYDYQHYTVTKKGCQ